MVIICEFVSLQPTQDPVSNLRAETCFPLGLQSELRMGVEGGHLMAYTQHCLLNP